MFVDYSRDSLLDDHGLSMLTSNGLYKLPHEVSPQDIFARMAKCYSFGDDEFAQRIYDYASKKWFSGASPVISNAIDIEWPTFGKDEFKEAAQWLKENVTPNGQPISCFKSFVPDTKAGLVEAATEQRWMSMLGGGVGIIPGMRGPDEKSTGVMAHIATYDRDTLAYKQTQKRRGSASVNLRVDHPEITNFITMRDPASGGDSNKKCFNINSCVLITDDFMLKMLAKEDYELIDPKHGPTGRFLNASAVWEELMDQRFKTGEPYILNIDTVNEDKNQWITNPDYHVSGTNLCVAPDTEVLTDKGCIAISTLENQYVNVWNGEEWSNVKVVKTGSDQPMITVSVCSTSDYDDYGFLECTPHHKWYLKDGSCVHTKDLKVGDLLLEWSDDTGTLFHDKVVKIEDNGVVKDSYCFTEPKRHMGVFNGILTGQCSEITLFTNEERSAVCCLSSVNMDLYDEWKDTQLIEDLVRFLDNVLEYFIQLAPKELKRAIYSAQQERAIGIGEMGFHSYLQRKMIPFEGGGFNSSIQITNQTRSKMREKAIKASLELGEERGEAPDCAGTGMRNSALFAIAPNGNSADILGVSPSREPYKSNAYLSEGRAGSFIKKNPHLELELEKLGMNTDEMWNTIMRNDGSIQHISGIPERLKMVFKTAREIDMMWVVELAAEAQKYVCQSISTNIFVRKDITKEQMSDIHIKGWMKRMKAFYYCRAQGESITLGTGTDAPLNSITTPYTIDFHECLSCQG